MLCGQYPGPRYKGAGIFLNFIVEVGIGSVLSSRGFRKGFRYWEIKQNDKYQLEYGRDKENPKCHFLSLFSEASYLKHTHTQKSMMDGTDPC